MVRWFVSTCVLACCLTAVASAQEKLAFKLEDGRKLVYQSETKTDQTLTIAGMDIDTKVTVFQNSTHALGQRAADGTIKETHKVDSMQVDMQLPGGLSFNFDSGNPNKAPDNAALEPVAKLFRVACETITTLVYDRNNALKEVEVPADIASKVDPMFQNDFSPEKLKKQTEQQVQFLPAAAVKSGDKWEVNSDVSIGGGQTFSFRTEYQYTGQVEKNGKQVHRITSKPLSVSYAMDPTSPSPLKVVNSDLKIADADGEVLFDNERGVMLVKQDKVHIVGPMTFSINGQELAGKVDLTISHKSQVQP